MRKPRLDAIEYIRGISMLGVVGIHVGSQYLTNPTPNVNLTALFEVFTRFSVPIFFFISAFGMFYNMDMKSKFDYKDFLGRRIKTVLVPYLVWSAFYMGHYVLLWHDKSILNIRSTMMNLFFGTANYQLYFMVILLWFYLMMPLWVWLVKRMSLPKLGLLLVAQMAFDYWSSYILNSQGINNYYLKLLINWRLNYLVIHYAFIFILGGYLAVHFDAFKAFMRQRRGEITAFFWVSMAALLTHYYSLVYVFHYDQMSAMNTAHQLSPLGIIYTLAASLYFFTIFTYYELPEKLRPILSLLGRHSYFMYLAHPIAITYLGFALARSGLVFTAPNAIIFYCAVVLCTLALAILMRKLGNVVPLINMLTIGVYKKKK